VGRGVGEGRGESGKSSDKEVNILQYMAEMDDAYWPGRRGR
jgi:hypothetical protein